MQMTVVQIIQMVVVLDGTMAAIGSVSMRVSVMNMMGSHRSLRGEG